MILMRSSVTRAQDALSLDVTSFGANKSGHLGGGWWSRSQVRTTRSAELRALPERGEDRRRQRRQGHRWLRRRPGQRGAEPKPVLIKFVLSTSRASAQYRLSATSRDVWTWHSRPQPGAAIPAPWRRNLAAVAPPGIGTARSSR
jgi:hypothetical protein